jgi:hypothetical protein
MFTGGAGEKTLNTSCGMSPILVERPHTGVGGHAQPATVGVFTGLSTL